ncbi:hypothetical protein BC629DRAFT_412679 [Irpex lacteus]|nr:hypothetical protein BC629DRAFT_412679 [Irpex lacteus]
MAKEVREFDEKKVRSCKEDIDTLLVFAGLFSAVLSAFLVAAYPSLQIDRMDTVVYTLQLIASQTAGYNIVGNAITSSNTPPSPPPPFKAAQNDIRVNVLWFASLIISLVTASFAMLVKQWLREFLSVDVPSPQARLRLRNFRQPQIEVWLVYEIAASLPLLLQLSLGLFFIGLCYFTAAIHTSIRYTTLPLVVGWALFFFTAATLPVFFPLCPYKTTLLKAAVTRLHQAVRSLADRAWDRYRLILDDTLLGPRLPPLRKFNISTLWSSLLRTVFRSTLPGLQSLSDERGVIKAEDQDIEILVSTDAILANDELLLTTISEALRYGHFHWTDVVDFVVQVLAHRLPTIPESERMLPAWPFSSAFPFYNLRPQIITGAIRILSESIDISKSNLLYHLSALSPGAVQDSEGSRLLCLFTIIIAAVLVDDNYISSNAGILCTLGWLLNAQSRFEQLWKDWLRLAVGRNVAHEEPRDDPDQERIRVAYKLLYSFNTLLEHQPPGTLFLARDGLHLFETLMETNLNTWWQGFDWTNLEEFSALLCREGYLHHLCTAAGFTEVSQHCGPRIRLSEVVSPLMSSRSVGNPLKKRPRKISGFPISGIPTCKISGFPVQWVCQWGSHCEIVMVFKLLNDVIKCNW